MKLQNVKGSFDYLPEDQRVRNYINKILKDTFEEYGYFPIETPILCYYDMLSGKYDSSNDLLREIYKLQDQGKRELGLRYDLTVPFAKFIALNKNQIKFPFKRYEIAKVFRDGPVKVGRDREFTQCDVDVVGQSGQEIEAELLCLYVSAFKKLGIEIEILYNSRNLMRGLVKSVGVEEELVSSVITVIDKMKKLSRQEFIDELLKIGLNLSQIDELFDIFKLSLAEMTKRYQANEIEELKIGLEELQTLSKAISSVDISSYCTFDATLARGQDYYTGNVFEVYEKNRKLTSSIGGGGRYDKMITDFIEDGNIYPAVGISFGLTSIFELLKSRETLQNKHLIDVMIIPMNTKIESLKLANLLRDEKIKVEVEYRDRKLKKCLDSANKEKIPYVIIVGEDEILNKKIVVKDMNRHENIEFSIDDIKKIAEYLKS